MANYSCPICNYVDCDGFCEEDIPVKQPIRKFKYEDHKKDDKKTKPKRGNKRSLDVEQ